MAEFKIPKRFKLFEQTIEVKLDPNLDHEESAVGMSCLRYGSIKLQPPVEGQPITRDKFEQTFLHELMHWITYFSDRVVKDIDKPLHLNEDFIELTSLLLHQALTTMEYDE